MPFKTEQEEFWRRNFGNEYTERNSGEGIVASNLALFARALRRAGRLRNCIEFGADIGLNLRALQTLYPGLQSYAVEINPLAAAELAKLIPPANVAVSSIVDFVPTGRSSWCCSRVF
jgi:hypothetical protein